MSNYSTQPRILFVTPEAAFIPEGAEYRPNYTSAPTGGFREYPAELISDLFHPGVEVHVAQPDYGRIFAISAQNEPTNSGIKLPNDRVQLAEGHSDFSYSPLGQVLAQKWKAGCACEVHSPPHIGLNPTSNKKLDGSFQPKDHHAGNQKNDLA